MDITFLRCGESAKIVAVQAPAQLKERLRALQIKEGEELVLLKTSPKKGTYLVRGASLICLGKEVAQCVLIRKK